jgi:hypothetical protein
LPSSERKEVGSRDEREMDVELFFKRLQTVGEQLCILVSSMQTEDSKALSHELTFNYEVSLTVVETTL